MSSLKEKFKKLAAPTLAAITLAVPQMAQANHTRSDSAPKGPTLQQVEEHKQLLSDMFSGKSFDERKLMEETIAQKDWLRRNSENKSGLKTAWIDAEDLSPEALEKDGYLSNETPQELASLIMTGHKQLDTTLSYQDQLKACGFDMLLGVLDGSIDSSKLSDEQFDKLRTQYDYSKWTLEKYPCYDRDNFLLGSKIFPEQEAPSGIVRKLTSEETKTLPKISKTVINGHDVTASSYEEKIANQACRIVSGNTKTSPTFLKSSCHEL